MTSPLDASGCVLAHSLSPFRQIQHPTTGVLCVNSPEACMSLSCSPPSAGLIATSTRVAGAGLRHDVLDQHGHTRRRSRDERRDEAGRRDRRGRHDRGVLHARCRAGTASFSGPCPCSIWNPFTTTPTNDEGDESPVELGVRFRSDTAGYVTGVRFYKFAANTGVHVGNLWTNTGALLARATFTGESGTGWQQVTFSPPVLIAANTTYVASYHTDSGHYASSDWFFTSGVDNAPLHALRRRRRRTKQRLPLRRDGLPGSDVSRRELLGRRGVQYDRGV